MRQFELLPKHYWKINLLEEDHEEIKAKGRLINQTGKSMGLKSLTMDESDEWNIKGAYGEWAVEQVYNIKCRTKGFTSLNDIKANVSDMDYGVEVKTASIKEPYGHNLVINKSQLMKPDTANRIWVNVLTGWLPDWIVVQGWVFGHELIKHAYKTDQAKTGNPVYVLKGSFLKDPISLFDVLRVKQLD